MRIRLQNGLPIVAATLSYRGRQLVIEKALLDTGSAGTVFSADRVSAINMLMEPQDRIRRIRGVGGAEFVFSKQVDALALGALTVADFEIEIGAMDYGFDIQGIVGMDFLIQTGAVIDLAQLELFAPRP